MFDLVISLLVEVDVVVEYLYEQLDLHGAVHALVSDAQALLKALNHTLPVPHLQHRIIISYQEQKMLSEHMRTHF